MNLLLDVVEPADDPNPAWWRQRAREFACRCDDEDLDRIVAFAPDTPLGRAYREACFLERDARRIADICSDAELDRILGLPDSPERAVYKGACLVELRARGFARSCDDESLRHNIAAASSERQEKANRDACIAEELRRSIIEAYDRRLRSGFVPEEA
ncbi:hypothetical protein [Nannocystis bainbridge]|uniref:Uncharacterized protein n=1 Tax=Nannocystis bainbridge TaxID=2995303 RepID=A0ABT5E4Q9_9BACT|nr:hypothetical protein [Nannocystis bainbridge]MDC0720848.1 hypothetical protein [Nannocystis bainbridge]